MKNSPQVKIRSSVEKLHLSPTLEIHEYVNKVRSHDVQVLHMGFGQSPFPVHALIREALAANADKNMYLPSAGLPELRRLACDYLAEFSGFEADGFAAIIGPGSKELIYDIQLAVEGDLMLPVPSWVSYAPQASLTQDQVVKILTSVEDNLHITAEKLENAIIEARVRGLNPKKLILNYPNNPSGLTISPSQLATIAQVCEQYELLVISDEIYGLINFQQEHVSIARFYPQGTIVTSGLSKHISLGGYRLGIALIPQNLKVVYDAVVRIASETWSTVSAPIQYAALKAFGKDPEISDYIQSCTEIHNMVTGYIRNKIVSSGISYPELHGAFYLFPNFNIYRKALKSLGVGTSDELAKVLIAELHITTLPGTAFGDTPENLTLRLACCDYEGGIALDYFSSHPGCSAEDFVSACCPNIVLACERLQGFFNSFM